MGPLFTTDLPGSTPSKFLSIPTLEVTMQLISPVFSDQELIPAEYTCDGDDRSPPLRWDDAPPGTASFTLICDDPDAPGGTFVHWVVFNLPAEQQSLPAGVPTTPTLPEGGLQGQNDFGNIGYGGPCPPHGTHRYFFKLYALDCTLTLPAGARKPQVETAMQGHVLATAELMGRYQRSG